MKSCFDPTLTYILQIIAMGLLRILYLLQHFLSVVLFYGAYVGAMVHAGASAPFVSKHAVDGVK